MPHQNCTVDEQWQNTAFYIINRSMVVANPKNHTNMYSNWNKTVKLGIKMRQDQQSIRAFETTWFVFVFVFFMGKL